MRYFLLIAIVAVSLCIEIPFLPFSQIPSNVLTPGTIEVSNEEIYVSAKALPTEVSGGSNVTLVFQVTNKANYDLVGVNLDLYDPCVFNEVAPESIGTLKSNQTKSWSWTLKSGVVTLSRDCELKFRVEYKGKFSLFQDIAVLTLSEYNTRLMQGTLKNLPISSSSSSSPLKISLSFTEDQPFLDGTSTNAQINYAYTGDGFIDVKYGGVAIKVPDNLQGSNPSCTDYNYDSGTQTLSLNKTDGLKFISKRSTPSICTFTTKASQMLDIKSLILNASYKYMIDGSIPITVKGTSTSQPSETLGSEGCLLKGSKILTPEGFKKIEDLKVGDFVMGYKDGKRIPTRITKTSSYDGEWTLYYYKNTWFTGNHKVYPSLDEEAVPVPLVSTQTKEYVGYVYNIETETHNYFGESDLLIHNVMKT